MQRKLVLHQPKNQLSTSKNKFFLSKLFSPNSKSGFYQQQNSSDQKNTVPLGRKSVSTSQMKDIQKSVTTIRKNCCYFKKSLKKLVSNGSSLEIDFTLISIIVSACRKNLRIKQYCFQQTKNLISLAGTKYCLKNMLQLAALSEKWRKIDLHWSENKLSTNKNKLFL